MNRPIPRLGGTEREPRETKERGDGRVSQFDTANTQMGLGKDKNNKGESAQREHRKTFSGVRRKCRENSWGRKNNWYNNSADRGQIKAPIQQFCVQVEVQLLR
jgi:hypothetical protein